MSTGVELELGGAYRFWGDFGLFLDDGPRAPGDVLERINGGEPLTCLMEMWSNALFKFGWMIIIDNVITDIIIENVWEHGVYEDNAARKAYLERVLAYYAPEGRESMLLVEFG